jgi:hypothetical protein
LLLEVDDAEEQQDKDQPERHTEQPEQDRNHPDTSFLRLAEPLYASRVP